MYNAGSFDYVIVGAGSAGCVLANRLSENPNISVALIEAGRKDTYPWIHVPIGYFKTIHNPKYDWCYRTDEDPGINGRRLEWPRGKVLGGSSSLNGLLYVRGQAQDYDDWADAGCTGWSHEDVLPYFIKSENRQSDHQADRGRGGLLNVSDIRVSREICDRFIEACKQNGHAENPDYNAGDQEGVANFQLTMKNGFRHSTASAFLRPAKKRKNLTVLTNHMVEGLEFGDADNPKRVTAVMARYGGGSVRISANREVVLSAGAIGSPQLLQLSGIGEAASLSRAGVDVRHALSGVGKNLQDHLQIRLIYKVKVPTLNDEVNSWFGQAKIGLQYILTRRGPMALGASQTAAFLKSRDGLDRPDIQYHVQPLSSAKVGHGLDPFSAFTASVCQLRPTSKGEINIKSADPNQHPSIVSNYLSSNEDAQVAIDSIKLTRKIADQPALAEVIESEHEPGAHAQSDAEILDWARERATTIYHPAGTCKMGVGPDAVVDPRLKVHGLDNLRVVDCSVMPNIVSGNTNAPTIMIAEKASDMILEDRKAA